MQFALPPRKNLNAPLYGHSSRLSLQRRKQLKAVAILGFALLVIYFLLSQLFHSSTGTPAAPAGTSSLVIVSVLDRVRWSSDYIQKITNNREDYAMRHGYTNFFANLSDYESTLDNAPRSWAVVPAVRHAMAAHPHSKQFFYLDAHALIMNPSKSLESHLLEKDRLDSLMLKDVPVVPPDSIIKTFSHLRPKDVDLILTTDNEDLSSGSFIIRQGEFAHTFLDIWFDPLYRSYNFAKAEAHALDHIVQWHPTILARLALVPQRTINAYSKDSAGAGINGNYKDGDLVIRFFGCDTDTKRSCEKEMDPYWRLWTKRNE
ncbi:putative alpha-1,6-mannosyltransferase subunit [Aspergillus alliaceus]|uniref:putative alpha-1,6-mannosyltransferase subunit n=1 Tax=Petromyces alliaceus TaxID=209559 RepID=UPI0012A554B2|nr:galactosyl transferase GMA12/MNN10 family-domain-containing protein [Aspergillus alliaceus]KAB8239392.1 galactosyl transferase GMA12/MNN10 family-domain-containing protein [Aspergillus alliaceus]